MARPTTPVNWIAIRTAYVVKGWTAQKCAEEFTVSRPTISARASKEGWLAERNRNLTESTNSVIQSQVREAVQDAIGNHGALSGSVSDLVKRVVDAADPREFIGRSGREGLKALVDACRAAIQLDREVHGLKVGDASSGQAAADESVHVTWSIPEVSEPSEAEQA